MFNFLFKKSPDTRLRQCESDIRILRAHVDALVDLVSRSANVVLEIQTTMTALRDRMTALENWKNKRRETESNLVEVRAKAFMDAMKFMDDRVVKLFERVETLERAARAGTRRKRIKHR